MDIRGDIQQVKDDLAVQSEAAALGPTVLDAYSKYAQKQAAESNAALEAKLASEGKLDGLTTAQREAVIRSQPEYNSTDYGPGSAFWTKGSAAAGLLAGALGGNMQAGAAAGAAPLLASLVKNIENDAARAALHGIVAAALTQLAGGSGADGMKAGAAGAVTASLLSERLVSALYGKDVSQLTADEKSLVSNLVTLAGAGVGYAAGGGDVSLAAVGANTARVEVENNSLKGKVLKEAFEEAVELCVKNPNCRGSLNAAGLSQNLLLTKEQIEQAQQAGVSRDPARIAKLSPEQIIWLDSQILAGTGIAGLMFGKLTWGDRLERTVAVDPNDIPELEGLPIPNEPGGTAFINPVPERNKSDGIYITPEQKLDKDAGILPGAEINIGDWRDNIYTSNNKDDINASWHQGGLGSSGESLLKHFEKYGREVGADSAEQYLHKARTFATNLKGSRKANIGGATEGVIRHYKNGKYIDIASDGRIISFGKQ